MSIGENIKRARKDKGLTQEELGKSIKKSGQYISYLEADKKKSIDLGLISSIAVSYTHLTLPTKA